MLVLRCNVDSKQPFRCTQVALRRSMQSNQGKLVSVNQTLKQLIYTAAHIVGE